jgi:hypothetical protein
MADHSPKKEFPWGMMFGIFLGIVLIGIGISIGFPAMGQGIAGFFMSIFAARPGIDYGLTTLMRLLGILFVVALVVYIIRSASKQGEHH